MPLVRCGPLPYAYWNISPDTYVAVFSKSWCPYCKATKETLSGLGAKAYILELDQIGKIFLYREDMGTYAEQSVDDGAAIQDALQEITSQRSVPNIFINHKHIGGNSDLQSRKSELPDLLKEAGAI